jgi:putative DNA primase/helicase
MTNPLIEAYATEKRWCLWRKVTRDGKQTKAPYRPSGRLGDSTDAGSWITYREASANAKRFDGIGIVFTPDQLLLGVDLDKLIADGKIANDAAARFVAEASSYTEVSPSGAGLHVFLRLTAPLALKRNRSGPFECYTAGRFFTFTGKPYGDALPLRTVTPDQAIALLQILGYPWPAKPKAGPAAPAAPRNGTAKAIGDDELIGRMLASESGARIEALMDGDSYGYPSASEADQALVNHLAWWTNRDAAQIERLWLASKAGARSKTKSRPDYRKRTIESALALITDGYHPGRTRQREAPPADDGDAGSTPPPPPPEGRRFEESQCTDTMNATRFARQHGEGLRYVSGWGWMVYDSTRWQRDETGAAMRRAKRTARSIYTEAGNTDDAEQAKRLAAWATASLSRNRLDAMQALAQSELPARTDAFDKDPMLLNVTNGTLSLQTLELRPHRAGDQITHIAGAPYDPAARCPLWLKFLDRIMDHDQDMIAFLQRMAGYSLTGNTTEHAFFFLYGTGRNGKSTFTETLSAALGDYAGRVRSDTLLTKRDSAIPNDLASLSGARMVIASELPEGRRLDEPLIKDLTGGDTVKVRFLHREYFEFRPQAKILIFGNHRPTVKGTDEGMWSRVRLVPFTVTIPEAERNPKLAVELRGELAGIMAWAVAGCKAWQAGGLKPPAKVKAATAAYRGDQDTLAQFLTEVCVMEPQAKIKSSVLYDMYKAWAAQDAMTQNEFGRRLSERGIERDRATGGHRLWKGIRLAEMTDARGS